VINCPDFISASNDTVLGAILHKFEVVNYILTISLP